MGSIAVVHLVRRKNGLAPFQRFLASYRAHAAGVAHDLVILFKGFSDECSTHEYDELLGSTPHGKLFVPDEGFDVNAYFLAVTHLDHEYFCFLNSYSQILGDDWLKKLYRWTRQDGVGLVGATGSCQSIAGQYPAHQRQAEVLPTAARWRARLALGLRDRSIASLARRALLLGLRLTGVWRPAREFPPFPNYHIRTNAFMGARKTLREVRLEPIRTKLSAWRFESGTSSLTNQVLRLGLRVLVVGRDGNGYEPERWHLSNTFWQSREENLLVSDNQTEAYLAADPAAKAQLALYAWGSLARPA